MTTEQKLEAFKAEHPDAFQAIFDQGFKAGQVKGGEDALKLERERIEAVSGCATFSGRHEFILGQVRAGNDVARAKGEFADVMAKENTELRKAQADAGRRERLANAAHPQGEEFAGVNPSLTASNTNATQLFEQRIAEQIKAGKTRQQAVNAVATADPTLYQEFLAAASNPKR